MSNKPKHGFCSPVTVTRIIDGDTIEVEIKRKFAVRLVHENDEGKIFNCPERKTPKGQIVKEFVENLLTRTTLHGDQYKDVTLFIPAGQDVKLMDINSFNRILAELWINERKLTDILIDKGYGKLE